MDDRIIEREFWYGFIKSPEYRYLTNVFIRHRDRLNKDSLLAIREGEYEEAGKLQAKAEDMDKIINLIEKRLKEMEVI